MTSAVEPEVTIELDKPRVFRLDFNTIVMVEEKLGINLLNEEVDIQKMGAAKMRTLLWCFMVGADPELTEEEVGSLVHMRHMNTILVGMNQLQERAVGKENATPVNRAERRAKTKGKNTTGS